MRELSEEQKSQADSLRKMQMDMLDKVEKYEKARREQAGELAKINALLKGKRTTEEKIQLAIKSLNMSLSALKRAREIIVEIAAFFKSFADFMGVVGDQAKQREKKIGDLMKRTDIGASKLKMTIKGTETFFIKQAGEWNAVKIVSDKFIQNFSEGWSKLNTLSGKYITGDELTAYLEAAADRITQISQERRQAANDRIADLDAYRAELRKQQTA